jgi:hypothetical protein
VLRRNLSFAFIVEDDAALSVPASRSLRPRGLLHALDGLAHASVGFSVMYVGGGQAVHAPPTWPQVARVAAGLRGNGSASFRALRAPPLKSPSTRFSHGYLLSAQVRDRDPCPNADPDLNPNPDPNPKAYPNPNSTRRARACGSSRRRKPGSRSTSTTSTCTSARLRGRSTLLSRRCSARRTGTSITETSPTR